MHEWFELTIPQVCVMPTPQFLDRCAQYLDAAIIDDRRRDVDRQAREYARRYLDMDLSPEEREFNWHQGL